MKVREVHQKDAETIAELSNQLGYPTTRSEIHVRLGEIIESDSHQVYVVEDQSPQLIGWVHVFGTKSLVVSPYAELGGLVVENTYRRKGIGSTLLYAAETWAWQEGYAFIRIRSNTLREDAHQFYLARGYQIEKSQHVFAKNIREGEKPYGD